MLEWEWWIVNRGEGSGLGQFKVLYQHCTGATEENHKISHSGKLGSGWKQNRTASHLIMICSWKIFLQQSGK